jgi:hypothetical protein
MNDFLNEVHKKKISDNIRRHNKKKKLQRESAKQENNFNTAYIMETVNIVEKSYEPKILNSSTLSHDIKPVNKVNRFSENLKLSYEKEAVTNTSFTLIKVGTEKLENER